MHKKFDHNAIEKKWQAKWSAEGVYKTADSSGKSNAYILDMFPYPSGEGLHVGHPKGYIATDIYARYKRMSGHEVLHPMGWDAFGLPAENYALKNKIHPRIAVEKNIARYKEQLQNLGLDYDWSREINTTDPEYYKWTQWIFLKLFEKGLAYQSHAPINWCPSCQTGLANEDLEDGKCERCGSVVERKPMRQWVLKITDYADRMLADLDLLTAWPTHIKDAQRNWIGRSEGLMFRSPVKDTDITIETFSAHFEAFYADTFVVIAPDHPLLPRLLEGMSERENILAQAKAMTEKRMAAGYGETREVEGIFTGRYTLDPVGNGELPIWIASYALAEYGTGIVKCSAHDERDFRFAKKYGIRLKPVLFPKDAAERERVERLEVCYSDMQNGLLSEPAEFAGKHAGEYREQIAKHAVQKGFARRTASYRLQDWVFSRQRYWGEPIPIIHCEKCGTVPVPEKDLPVCLPEVEHYEPTGTGESPLANITEWVNTTCPKCGGAGKRETNTMPQWAGSCWYYLRFIDPNNNSAILAPEKEKKWAPVDVYVGGEHATRHLIYARFWHKFLYDIDVVHTLEPFIRLEFLGFILAEDGRKMSKRWGNIINPDDIVAQNGADTLRVYEMFMGPFENTIGWSTNGLVGVQRFLERAHGLAEHIGEREPREMTALLARTIDKVTRDIEQFKFNTAISALMIFVNAAEKGGLARESYTTFLKLLAPFAPHLAEELWEKAEGTFSIHTAAWPVADEKLLTKETATIAVQINGKVRGTVTIPTDADDEAAKAIALADKRIARRLSAVTTVTIRRVVYVPGKVLNFITQ